MGADVFVIRFVSWQRNRSKMSAVSSIGKISEDLAAQEG